MTAAGSLIVWTLILVSSSSSFQTCEEIELLYATDNNTTDLTCLNASPCTMCVTTTYLSSVLLDCDESSQCTYDVVPQQWPSECSLQTLYEQLPYYWQNSSYYKLTKGYWYPAKRNVAYGPYEYTSWGLLYGNKASANVFSNVDESMFSKNCLVEDPQGVIVPDYCHATHRRKCPMSQSVARDFCASSCAYCSESYNCFTSELFCVADQVACSAFNSCPTTNGVVHLQLSFNNKLSSLHLTIYHPECLYKGGHPDYVYCFTDATDQLRKRSKLKVVFNNGNFMVYSVELEEYMGQYWCEAKDSRGSDYKSNVLVAFKRTTYKKQGYEFAVRLTIDDVCTIYSNNNCFTTNLSGIIDDVMDDVKRPIESINGFAKVRLMKVNEFLIHRQNNDAADITIHVSTLSRRPTLLGAFYKLQGILRNNYPPFIRAQYCRSSERCLPDSKQNLTWPFAQQSQTVLPKELCLQASGAPVTRSCQGDFLGGLTWGSVEGECFSQHQQDFSNDTMLLQSLLNQTVSEQLMMNVSDIVHSTSNLSLIDLYLVSQILEKSSDMKVNLPFLNASLSVINGLLKEDFKSKLLEAQERLNITDSYLRVSEAIAVNLTDAVTLHKDNVIFHSFNPINQNASGFVLYQNHSVKSIPLNSTFNDITDVECTKLALYVPAADIENIISNNLTNVSITAIIYLNDRLFPATTTSNDVGVIIADVVLNLNIPNYESYLQSPIPLLVSSNEGATTFTCGFWDYGDSHQQKRGNWSSMGSNYDGMFSDNYPHLQLCSYSHLTHLALLVVAEKRETSLGVANDQVLDLLTGIGSLLSLLGICGIFMTSCLSRSWRDKAGTQILLHLSLATLFEIVFMYLNGVKMFDCAIAGCILHYVIISKFAWMLVYAYCQYLRFVRVFGPMPDRVVLKSVIFGWGLGIGPAVSVVTTNPDSYYQDTFCYPVGISLYLGLYLPVAIILCINVCVFVKIMCEVTNSSKLQSSNLKTLHLKLAVLLFSVLGIPWCFGLLSNVMPFVWLQIVFVYIFTIMSILQGFLMFLFYVIFNKETKQAWNKLLKQKKTYRMFSSSKKTKSVSSIT